MTTTLNNQKGRQIEVPIKSQLPFLHVMYPTLPAVRTSTARTHAQGYFVASLVYAYVRCSDAL